MRRSAAQYQAAGDALLAAYKDIHARMDAHLREKLPRPEAMKPEAYGRNIAARAFDVARYLLFWGVPTNVGQVTSIRTLEKQIRRLRVSEFAEVRELGLEIAEACAAPPECAWDDASRPNRSRPRWRGMPSRTSTCGSRRPIWKRGRSRICELQRAAAPRVDLMQPDDTLTEIAATLLYPVCGHSVPGALSKRCATGARRARGEVLDVALQSRGARDDLLRGFRGGQYCFDMLIDIGAYRDMHRHRRCHQYRQAYSGEHGYEVAGGARGSRGARHVYAAAMDAALGGHADAAGSGARSICCRSARGRDFCSRWISRKWNISRACAAG